MRPLHRRRFLMATGRACGLGGLGALLPFSGLAAADPTVTPDLVRWRPEMLPLVKLIETTPRDTCVEMLAGELRKGTPLRELMAAAFLHALAYDGHHTVYLVHAALELSRQLDAGDHLLPLFWAVDVVKEHIDRFGEKPAPPLAGSLPAAAGIAAEFRAAMDAWESERAERAVIGLARAAGASAALQEFCHYAARDWSFIGHVPIAVSNAWRTLGVIGHRHAEPTLRYLVRELQRRNAGRTQGQPYDANQERVRKQFERLPPDWADDTADQRATLELLQVLRSGRWSQACEWIATELTAGRAQAGSAWDAVHLAAAEFMVRFKLGNIRLSNRALHANTSSNALHHLFIVCRSGRTRFLLLLQAAAWVADFTRIEAERGMLRELKLTELPPVELPATPQAGIERLFSRLPPRHFQHEVEDRSGQDEAAQLALAIGQSPAATDEFLATARQLLVRKATINSHDIKFPMAIFENRDWVSASWRPHLLAASVHFLHGTQMPDNSVTQRARAALRP